MRPVARQSGGPPRVREIIVKVAPPGHPPKKCSPAAGRSRWPCLLLREPCGASQRGRSAPLCPHLAEADGPAFLGGPAFDPSLPSRSIFAVMHNTGFVTFENPLFGAAHADARGRWLPLALCGQIGLAVPGAFAHPCCGRRPIPRLASRRIGTPPRLVFVSNHLFACGVRLRLPFAPASAGVLPSPRARAAAGR